MYVVIDNYFEKKIVFTMMPHIMIIVILLNDCLLSFGWGDLGHDTGEESL